MRSEVESGKFRSGDVAKMFNMAARTVNDWTEREELSEFFSDSAKRVNTDSVHRYYDMDDVHVVHTVLRLRRNQNMSWDEIADVLQSGTRYTDLPASAALVETITPAEHFTQLTKLKSEYDALQVQHQNALAELEGLRHKVENIPGRIRGEYQAELQRLNREIGKLEALLEIERSKRSSD